mgnify:CR=1 FL=1
MYLALVSGQCEGRALQGISRMEAQKLIQPAKCHCEEAMWVQHTELLLEVSARAPNVASVAAPASSEPSLLHKGRIRLCLL